MIFNFIRIVPVVNPDGYEYVRSIYSNNQFALIEEIELIIKNRNPAQT
jgi:murein tripeptide amidase MpaA